MNRRYFARCLVLAGLGVAFSLGGGGVLYATAIQVDLDSDGGRLYSGDGPAQVVDGHGELGTTWLTGSGNGAGDATLISGPPDIILDTGDGGSVVAINWGAAVDHAHEGSVPTFYQNNLLNNSAWSPAGPPATIGARVSGLAPGSYRVYAIAVRQDDLSATFDVGIGINDTLTTQTAGGIGAGDPAETAWVAGKNYVFSDVTVGSTSDFVTIASSAIVGVGNPNGRGYLQGFQIVSIVPEPNMLTLLATGPIALAAYALRRRR